MWDVIKVHLMGAVEVAENIYDVVMDQISPLKEEIGSLDGKTAVVTGGNAGIGLATAEALVRHGAHVVLACRSEERGQRAVRQLQAVQPAAGCQRGSAEVEQVDLTSLASAANFCDRMAARGGADFLFLNAGIMAPPQQLVTADGFEAQYQVNYLCHWLLANRLVSARRRRRRHGGDGTGPVRAVFFSSVTHMAGHIAGNGMEELQAPPQYGNGFLQYARTKLACLLAAKEMQRRLDSDTTGVQAAGRDVAVAVHPGLVDTYLAREFFKSRVTLQPLRLLTDPLLEHVLCPSCLRTPQAAARLVIKAATACDEEVAGKYLAGRGVAACSEAAEDAVLASELWQHTRQLCTAGGFAAPDELV